MLGLFRRACARQDPDMPPVRPDPGRTATIRRKGSEPSRTGRVRECHLARSYALQPVHPQTLGLGFQMLGQTHRTVKTAAKLRNRLQPRLGRDLEPIENRLQSLGYHTMGPASQLTTRPVAPGSSGASSAIARGRWLDASDANRLASWLRRHPAALALLSSTARCAHPARWD